MRTARRKSKFAVQEDADPLSVVVNLFDVAMVFAVALMVGNGDAHDNDRSFYSGRFYYREKSWERQYGDYHERGK